MTKVEAALEKAWGFAFPRDLFVVWDVARTIDRKHPLDAFLDTIGVRLEGPFHVLAGAKVPSDRGRWASDPPELFTIASGDTDGLHWGYVVHDPGNCDPVCAHFHSRDGYPITLGTTLFDALRQWLVDVRREKNEELAETERAGERDVDLAKHVAEIDRALGVFAKHRAPPKPKRMPTIAATLDGLGVACAKNLFLASKTPKPEKSLALAKQMLAKGKPGGALKIARDAYAVGALVKLGYVSLAGNRIRVMPDIFDRLPRLFSLWLDHSRLSTLPDSIGAVAKKLDSLGIGGNPLTADKAQRDRIKKLLPKTKIFWTLGDYCSNAPMSGPPPCGIGVPAKSVV